jgi:protein-S-isoprenylcysteine O-methyltransferase Ste14
MMAVMINALSVAGAVVFACIGLIHLYWAGGGSQGSTVVIPSVNGRPALHPGPVATVVVAVLLFAASVIYLGAARDWQPGWSFRLGAFVAGVVLIARAVGDRRTVGLTKRAKNTTFARLDTWVFSPLCLALGVVGLGASLI